jgi:hypothetical protein
VGPDTFFCRTSQWGYATPRPPPRSSYEPGLESRYEPQKGQHYYHDDDHHYDGDQVTGTHQAASAKTSGETASSDDASLEEPRQQQ